MIKIILYYIINHLNNNHINMIYNFKKFKKKILKNNNKIKILWLKQNHKLNQKKKILKNQ